MIGLRWIDGTIRFCNVDYVSRPSQLPSARSRLPFPRRHFAPQISPMNFSFSLALCRSRSLTPAQMAASSSPHALLLQQPLGPSSSLRCKQPLVAPLRLKTRLPTISSTAVQSPPVSPSVATERIFNFAAGPATLPESVILKAQTELYNYHGSGMSIMEMSHRGKEFDSVIKKAESDLRFLLAIPDDYAVLFLQGGATTQFAAVPLNLCAPGDSADFIVTGSWGDKTFKEAQKFCKGNLIWSGKSQKYTKIPAFDGLEQNPHSKFLHICANETRELPQP